MNVTNAVIAAASIYTLFQLRSVLKELKNAAKLLANNVSSDAGDVVDIAAEDVAVNDAGDAKVYVNAMINKISHTDDTATKIAHDVDTIMHKITLTDEGISKALELKTHDALLHRITLTDEGIEKVKDALELIMHNSHDALLRKIILTNEGIEKVKEALELIVQNSQKTHDAVNALPATTDAITKKYSMYLHDEHVEIMSAVKK